MLARRLDDLRTSAHTTRSLELPETDILGRLRYTRPVHLDMRSKSGALATDFCKKGGIFLKDARSS